MLRVLYSGLVTFLLLFSSSSSLAEDYDVARSTPPVIQSIANDLTFDEHGRLSHLAFVYDASNPVCHIMVEKSLQLYLRQNPHAADRVQLAAVEGHAFDRVLAPYRHENSGCLAACIERGTDRHLAGYVMPIEVYDSATWDTDDEDLAGWFGDNCAKKENQYPIRLMYFVHCFFVEYQALFVLSFEQDLTLDASNPDCKILANNSD